jgi:D-amino-acid dehydrogenase
MRPITPDGLPILDRIAFPNLYVASGYAMQGVTLAPPAGKAMAEFMTAGERPQLLEPFGVARLNGRRHREPARV